MFRTARTHKDPTHAAVKQGIPWTLMDAHAMISMNVLHKVVCVSRTASIPMGVTHVAVTLDMPSTAMDTPVMISMSAVPVFPTTVRIPVSTFLGPIHVSVMVDLDLMLMEELVMTSTSAMKAMIFVNTIAPTQLVLTLAHVLLAILSPTMDAAA